MTRSEARRSVYVTLLVVASLGLLVLPFVTTFDDFLTSVVKFLGLDRPLGLVVPVEARMVVAVLSGLHVAAAVHGAQLIVWNSAADPVTLFISWNCIGWQSGVLFVLSALTGLRGDAAWSARLQILLLGALGTFFVNLLRITLVCVLAVAWGPVPAILFHDYGGTLLVLGWLFAFWAFTYRWLLPAAA